jgi:hypothetical membrane protein
MRAVSPGSSPWLAAATAGPVIVVLALVALHAVKPELDPSWRFLSEYAIGPRGWIMQLTFMVWAVSCATLSFAVQPALTTRRGRLGAAILLIVGAALVMAGIFPQDPVTAAPSEATTAGMLHAIASMIGIPGIPVAAMLITTDVTRGTAGAAPALRLLAHATWFTLVVMVSYLMWSVPRAGGFNPEVWAGWMNRIVVLAYLAWQLALALHLTKRGGMEVAAVGFRMNPVQGKIPRCS